MHLHRYYAIITMISIILIFATKPYVITYYEFIIDLISIIGVVGTAIFTCFLMVHTKGLRESTELQVKASRVAVLLDLEIHLIPLIDKLFNRHQIILDSISDRILNDDDLFSSIVSLRSGRKVNPSQISNRHIFNISIDEIIPDDKPDFRQQSDFRQVVRLSIGFNPGSEDVAQKTSLQGYYFEEGQPRHGARDVMILSPRLVDELWSIMTPLIDDIWALRHRAIDFEGVDLLEDRIRSDWRLKLAWELTMAAWRIPHQHRASKMNDYDKLLWKNGSYEAYPEKTMVPNIYSMLPPNQWSSPSRHANSKRFP